MSLAIANFKPSLGATIGRGVEGPPSRSRSLHCPRPRSPLHRILLSRALRPHQGLINRPGLNPPFLHRG